MKDGKNVVFSTFLLGGSFLILIFYLGFTNLAGLKSVIDKKIDKYDGEYVKVIPEIDTSFTSQFSIKNSLININGLVSRVLGKNEVNDVIKLKDGRLSVPLNKTDVEEQVEGTKEFNDYLQSKEIPMMYIQYPYAISPEQTELPEGIDDYSNKNADELLQGLKEAGVDTLDIRELIRENKMSYTDLFYKTDHHWNVGTAFWAAEKIARALEEKGGIQQINEEVINKDNYTEQTYENWLLGSRGRRVGRFYGGLDDFVLFNPKFETDFSIEIPNREIEKTGKLEETLYFKETRLVNKDYFGIDVYGTFLNGSNNRYVKITNNSIKSKDKILIITDSFSRPMLTFLALQVKEIHSYDLRYGGTPEDLLEKIEEIQPTAVVVAYNPSEISKRSCYTFLPNK